MKYVKKDILHPAKSFIFKRNTPQLAAAGIKGMRIQFRLRSAWPGSNFMRQRLGCPAACGVGALPPFHLQTNIYSKEEDELSFLLGEWVACHICCNFTVALYPDST
ncbi:hypothetical protein, partial [Methanothrix soehngenii]|uniref:hypothetical protein n=1 Tax=Methanothrix soehngenii TaxID=2223 RepID=UPI002BB778B2|nr:hypothetical protein [Methanothrix soehngenii]HOS23623.1 hypothetical protein [Methanothrix soehngenii]HPL21882.1 hypothetical protein [Methanothrix soehngenii]